MNGRNDVSQAYLSAIENIQELNQAVRPMWFP